MTSFATLSYKMLFSLLVLIVTSASSINTYAGINSTPSTDSIKCKNSSHQTYGKTCQINPALQLSPKSN